MLPASLFLLGKFLTKKEIMISPSGDKPKRSALFMASSQDLSSSLMSLLKNYHILAFVSKC